MRNVQRGYSGGAAAVGTTVAVGLTALVTGGAVEPVEVRSGVVRGARGVGFCG